MLKMKFVILLLAAIGTTSAVRKCFQGLAATEATACTDAEETTCSSPIFKEFSGFPAGVAYKCGACTGTTKADGNCKECTTDGCNTITKTGVDYKCHSYTVEKDAENDNKISIAKKTDATVCKRLLSNTKTDCNMPTPTADDKTYTSKSGCGPCVTAEKDKGCKECSTAECNVVTAIKCVQSADGKGAATACSNLADTKCFMPKFVEFTGLATGVKYGCGECPSGTTDKTCATCSEKAADGCNKPVEAVEFKCNTFTWSATNKNFTAAATTCKKLKATAIACNMPAATATSANYTMTTGCGPCKTAEKDKGCKQCDKDMCNKPEEKKASAASITVLFVPLLAVIYTLF